MTALGTEIESAPPPRGGDGAPATTAVAAGIVGLHEAKEHAAFRGLGLAAVPSDLLTLRNLVRLDLSRNHLTRFPGALVAADLPRLEVLGLEQNLLTVLEDVLALSTAPRLRELALEGNPLRLVDHRVYLLEALFGAPAADDASLRMVHKDAGLTAAARVAARAAASGNGVRGGGGARAGHRGRGPRQRGTLDYVLRLPRRHGFPMLQRLNHAWITDGDNDAVERERGRGLEYYEPAARRSLSAGSMSTAGSTRHSALQSSSGGLPSTTTTAAVSTTTTTRTAGRRADGSRMTMREALRLQTRAASIPRAASIERVQVDVETGKRVCVDDTEEPLLMEPTAAAATDGHDDAAASRLHAMALALPAESQELVQRLFRPTSRSDAERAPVTNVDPAAGRDDAGTSHDHEEPPAAPENWNYPIRTFDRLSSEERQYVRFRSRQSVESVLRRDDHFFDSTTVLDCVAQAERSRRLTVHAVDTLCPRSLPRSASAVELYAPATRQLRETLGRDFDPAGDDEAFARIEAFRGRRPPGTSDDDMQIALGEYFIAEHRLQQRRTREILGTTAKVPTVLGPARAPEHSLEVVAASIEDSLSKTKLRNAVDLANVLGDKKQEKRVMQMLIDADAKVIEEERTALEQALHRHRLELIANNEFYAHSEHEADREWMRQAAAQKATPSPWQERNWRAKEHERRRQIDPPSTKLRPTDDSLARGRPGSAAFRSIETVEQASRATLPHVNSHDLLVRCAGIRQHADRHVQSLRQYRDHFLEGEDAWETMRQDPINIVRRHLRRQFAQDAQDIQVGNTHVFYSPLFS